MSKEFLPPIPQNLSDEVPFRKNLWKRIRSLEVTFCYVCTNLAKKKIKINNSIANRSNKTRSMKLATGETLRQDILHTQTFDFFVAFLSGTLSYGNKSSRGKKLRHLLLIFVFATGVLLFTRLLNVCG